MYLPNKDSPFYYNIIILQYMRLYPSAANVNNWKRYRIISAALGIIAWLNWIDYVIHLIVAVKDNIPIDKSRNIAEILGVNHCVLVCFLYEIYIKTWSSLYTDISDTSKFGVPPKMEAARQRAKRFSIFYNIYCISGVVVYSINAIFFESSSCRERNAKKGIHEVCNSVGPLWYPFEEIRLVTMLFLNLFQIYGIGFYILSTSVIICLTWECSELLVSKIHHLKNLFIETFNTEDPSLQKRRLRFCIQYHQEILSMATRLCTNARNVYGQMSFEAAIILSCIGTQTLQERSLEGLMHFVGHFATIFLVCLTGQTIQDETYNIQNAVYGSKWYTVNPKLARDIQLVLLRSQKPIFLESYLLGSFNYSLLVVIVKTSYSYLTLMYDPEK